MSRARDDRAMSQNHCSRAGEVGKSCSGGGMDRHSFAGCGDKGAERTVDSSWVSGRSDLTESGDTIPKTTGTPLLNE